MTVGNGKRAPTLQSKRAGQEAVSTNAVLHSCMRTRPWMHGASVTLARLDNMLMSLGLFPAKCALMGTYPARTVQSVRFLPAEASLVTVWTLSTQTAIVTICFICRASRVRILSSLNTSAAATVDFVAIHGSMMKSATSGEWSCTKVAGAIRRFESTFQWTHQPGVICKLNAQDVLPTITLMSKRTAQIPWCAYRAPQRGSPRLDPPPATTATTHCIHMCHAQTTQDAPAAPQTPSRMFLQTVMRSTTLTRVCLHQ